MTTRKLEVGKTINTDDLLKTLSNVENDGIVRISAFSSSDLFEAHVHPNQPPSNFRYCGRFNDYKESDGAVRPSRQNEWAITLVEQAGAAGGSR